MSYLPYLGEVQIFSGDFAPYDWAFCNGQLLQITEHDALYSLIGTAYGGDGTKTFALPDLRGRIPLHADSHTPLGTKGGKEEVAITADQLPVHTHTPNASKSNQPNTAGPLNSFWAANSTQQVYGKAVDADATMNAASIANSNGKGLGHENRVPFMAVNYIIALNGIYPNKP